MVCDDDDILDKVRQRELTDDTAGRDADSAGPAHERDREQHDPSEERNRTGQSADETTGGEGWIVHGEILQAGGCYAAWSGERRPRAGAPPPGRTIIRLARESIGAGIVPDQCADSARPPQQGEKLPCP